MYDYFLIRKTRYNRKMLRESDILNMLLRGEVSLPPLSINATQTHGSAGSAAASAEIRWAGRRFRFAVTCRASSSPKVVRDTVEAVKKAHVPGMLPLLIVPWLSPEQFHELESQQVSAIDLSGNGVLVVPGKLLVFRTGNPNAYPRSLPLRNVYRGDSSIVSRVFLLRQKYATVSEILSETRLRNGSVVLSTVSKVLKQLVEDLIVERDDTGVELLQPEKLLSQLSTQYRGPEIRGRLVGRCGISESDLKGRMNAAIESGTLDCVQTGASSAPRYAAMAREPIVSLYCKVPPLVAAGQLGVSVEPNATFPDIELLWADEQTLYFDRRRNAAGCYASPVQAWLELMAGDKRQRDTAEQLKALILDNLGGRREDSRHDRRSAQDEPARSSP